MESKKKIIIFILFLVVSCNEKYNYYNEQKNVIKSNNFKHLKYNLYIDDNNAINIRSVNTILEAGKKEKIIEKKEGFILQDSLFDSENKLIALSKILDLKSYLELEKDFFYKDKNHIYLNRGSQNNDYPFFVTEFDSKFFSLIPKSNYFKYKNDIFYYGYIGYIKLEDIDGTEFKVDSVKTNMSKYIKLGHDKENIYHNSEKIIYENFKKFPISQKIKDSLTSIYFKDNK